MHREGAELLSEKNERTADIETKWAIITFNELIQNELFNGQMS